MGNNASRFLNTTALVSPHAQFVAGPRQQQRSSGITIEKCHISNCGAGIVQVIQHRAPKLTDDLVPMIEKDQPEYITRHIEERFLSSARKGYFRFGTLVNYRATEGIIAGRLGDHQESRMQEVFNSRSGFFQRASLQGMEISNLSIMDTEKHIIVETVVNDLCSCSSIGEFELERGNEIRDHETDPEKKPGAYVTYHLPTLKLALERNFSKSPDVSGLALLGRKVEYDEKDRSWAVEKNFTYQRDRDAMAIWLGIAFVKSPSFKHEDEYRLLLTDPSGPGALDGKTENYEILESDFIAKSIVASGTY